MVAVVAGPFLAARVAGMAAAVKAAAEVAAMAVAGRVVAMAVATAVAGGTKAVREALCWAETVAAMAAAALVEAVRDWVVVVEAVRDWVAGAATGTGWSIGRSGTGRTGSVPDPSTSGTHCTYNLLLVPGTLSHQESWAGCQCTSFLGRTSPSHRPRGGVEMLAWRD